MFTYTPAASYLLTEHMKSSQRISQRISLRRSTTEEQLPPFCLFKGHRELMCFYGNYLEGRIPSCAANICFFFLDLPHRRTTRCINYTPITPASVPPARSSMETLLFSCDIISPTLVAFLKASRFYLDCANSQQKALLRFERVKKHPPHALMKSSRGIDTIECRSDPGEGRENNGRNNNSNSMMAGVCVRLVAKALSPDFPYSRADWIQAERRRSLAVSAVSVIMGLLACPKIP